MIHRKNQASVEIIFIIIDFEIIKDEFVDINENGSRSKHSSNLNLPEIDTKKKQVFFDALN